MIVMTPEIVVGGLSVIGGAVIALKKSGLITFGRPAAASTPQRTRLQK